MHGLRPADHTIITTLSPRQTGNQHTTTPHIRDLHPRIQPPGRRLQFPPPAPSSRRLRDFAFFLFLGTAATQRRPLTRDLPQLRDALFHRHLDLYRVPPRPPRPHPGLRRVPR